MVGVLVSGLVIGWIVAGIWVVILGFSIWIGVSILLVVVDYGMLRVGEKCFG